MPATSFHTPPRTVLEVFESLPEGTRCEVINNTLIMSPAPSDTHQKVLGKIFSQLLSFVDHKNIGELRIAPYDVYFDKENILQPDIVLILNENKHNIQERGFFGSPDVIIEVLSTSNSAYDKKDKKRIYEKFRVSEYWIVDPYEKVVTGFMLINERLEPIESAIGVLHSKAFGFTIKF